MDTKGKVPSGWFDIKLAPLKVGDVDVWMPVSGEAVGLMAVQDGGRFSRRSTRRFASFAWWTGRWSSNKHPGPGVVYHS